jgi:ribosomal protein S18 acetylase RimI-like enzyme
MRLRKKGLKHCLSNVLNSTHRFDEHGCALVGSNHVIFVDVQKELCFNGFIFLYTISHKGSANLHTIREMNLSDYEQAYHLWSITEGIGLNDADSKDAIASYLERNPGHSFVCEANGEIIGTVLCGHDGRRGYMYHVAVSERYRNQGIGLKLVNAALERLRSAGITKCHLMVYAANESGIRFWERTGWERRNDILICSKAI